MEVTMRTALLAGLLALCVFSSALNAQESERYVRNARLLQALIIDTTDYVTRYDPTQTDPNLVSKLLTSFGKDAKGALSDDYDRIATEFPKMVREMRKRCEENNVHEFYEITDKRGCSLIAIPAEELSDQQKAAVGAIIKQNNPGTEILESCGFIISYDLEDEETLKSIYKKPNDLPRPSIVQGLIACVGASVTTVWNYPEDIFNLPFVGPYSPLDKELERKLTYATLSFDVIDSLRAVVLLKTTDQNAMSEISSKIHQMIQTCQEEGSVLQKRMTMGNPIGGKLIPIIAHKLTAETRRNQMLLTVDVKQVFKKLAEDTAGTGTKLFGSLSQILGLDETNNSDTKKPVEKPKKQEDTEFF